MQPISAHVPPRLIKLPELCDRLGLGKTKVWQLIHAGQLRSSALADAFAFPNPKSHATLRASKSSTTAT